MNVYGPYTPIRKGGDTLFVSGQVGVDPTTKTAIPDIAQQTRQALQNMDCELKSVGADLQDVVKTTVFLVTMDHFKEMNLAYEQAFSAPRPARSTIVVHELPRVGGDVPILVEIEAVAYKEQELK